MLSSASDYEFVDVSGVDIQGRIVPTEDINHLPPALRLEDIAYLLEMACERGVVGGAILSPSNFAWYKQRLRKPSEFVTFLVGWYSNNSTYARLGYKASDTVKSISTDAEFNSAVSSSLLTASDLHWPSDIDPDFLPWAPSAELMRSLFYALNQIGGKWFLSSSASTPYDYAATFDMERSYDTEWYEYHWDGTTYWEKFHYSDFPTTLTFSPNTTSIEYPYTETQTYKYVDSDTPKSTVYQRTGRASIGGGRLYYEHIDNFTSDSTDNNGNRTVVRRRVHNMLLRTTPLAIQLSSSYYPASDCCFFARVRVRLPGEASTVYHYLWINLGVLQTDSANRVYLPMPDKATCRNMIKIFNPSETFDIAADNASWSCEITFTNTVYAFHEPTYKSELPSAWTWTP